MNDLSVIEREFGDLSIYADTEPFWVAQPETCAAFLDGLKQGKQRLIGRSVAGRDIIAIEYGQREPLETTTNNLHSAIASKVVPPDPTDIYPPAFYGSKRRRQPVVIFQGGIHGGELTGTVASLNLCNIIETGADLRGKAWPRIAELASRMRICVIPWLNPDATSRWQLWNPVKASRDLISRFSMGVMKDGTAYTHPAAKEVQPIPPDSTAFMGAYYNDNGINLQYDLMNVQRQPETLAWMQYYLDERPDGVVIWHCNSGSMMGPPEYYLPTGIQLEATRLAGAVRSRLLHADYQQPIGRMSWQLPGMGKPYLEQMSGTYHVCGATPVMCELPSGGAEYPFTLDDLLDIGLIAIEETLLYADTDGLRAYETWEKVRARMDKEN